MPDEFAQTLTEAEIRVLEQRSYGISFAQIAEAEDVHLDTVKRRAARAREKLGARDTAHAVVLALRLGLIPVGVKR